ncbi:nicastrin [Macrobrachium rosenbergii]|uniref:nicastrin n=1 Tax=Macrobrachium rosenbergii TaxID=79674 RepID=UPI0034D41AFA
MATSPVTVPAFLAKVLLLSLFFATSGSNRVKEKIYDKIQSDMACFKRFNGTHEIGCTSRFNGNIGVIHAINNRSDLDWVLDKGPHHPYMLALTPEFLTVSNLRDAQDSGKVSGVVVLVHEGFDPEKMLTSGFSGDYPCPNEEYGLYNHSSDTEYTSYCQKNPWNPPGSALLYSNWDFPIFLIDNQTSVDNIISCYEEFNAPKDGEPRSWPLCALELKSHMFGTTNTEVCMRRATLPSLFSTVNFCDPLYDFNLWGTVKPMNASEDLADQSVIIVAARMDAASMYDNISPGVASAVAGLVTLMSTAEAINRHREEIMAAESNKNIMFILYQGETWDYIGSSRMVWDMEKGEFPFQRQEDMSDQMSQINFTHIDYFIEISQVGKMEEKRLYLHTDPVSNSDPEINLQTGVLVTAFNMSASNSSSGIVFERAPEEAPLPPASFQSFLKHVNISGLVIADHKESFKNKFYQTVFDDHRNIKGEVLADVASVLATTLYTMVTREYKEIIADKNFTGDLLHCYSVNASCPMFKDFGGYLLKNEMNDGKPAKMYVNVKRGETGRTYVTSNIFARVMGEEVDMNETECKADSFYQIYQYCYLPRVSNGTCYRTTARKTEAMSPAFMIEDYDWQSGMYSTWAESGWQAIDAMLFLRPSVVEEVALVCGGVVSIVTSFALVHFMNSRSDLLFGLPTPPAAC